MPYRVTITEDAERHFRALSARDRRALQVAVASRLLYQPRTVTRAVKQLRPNPMAEYELRSGDFRVLYNVKGEEVVILVVGKKVGNRLFVAGEEFRGCQDDHSGSTGNGFEGPFE